MGSLLDRYLAGRGEPRPGSLSDDDIPAWTQRGSPKGYIYSSLDIGCHGVDRATLSGRCRVPERYTFAWGEDRTGDEMVHSGWSACRINRERIVDDRGVLRADRQHRLVTLAATASCRILPRELQASRELGTRQGIRQHGKSNDRRRLIPVC